MTDFTGFPAGKLRFTSIPDVFFSTVLPQIDTLAELKITLHIFWLLQRKKGDLRYVSLPELLADRTLMAGLSTETAPIVGTAPGNVEQTEGVGAGIAPPSHPVMTAEHTLREGLARAVARRTLLRVDVAGPYGVEPWFLPNTESGRRTLARLERGELDVHVLPPRPATQPATVPNIFTLYEQTIGLISSLLADELRDAEQHYPAGWIAEAFKIAAENNVRKWAYVRAILERWATEGKDDGTGRQRIEEDPNRYIKGKYAPFIRR